MIAAAMPTDLEASLADVAAQAAAQAEAKAREAALARTQDPLRWRDASLLWPAFASGQKG